MQHGSDISASEALRVHLLGPTRISVGTRIDQRFSPAALLLFAMLVLRRDEPHNRAELAFTLWPDREEKDARANLRRQLYLLQNALPLSVRRQLVCEPRFVAWTSNAHEWIDVVEFERHSAVPDGHEAAIYLYGGDFMPQVDHEWFAARRAGLQALMRRNLEDAIRRREAQGDFIATLRYVEALLEREYWREDILRKFMQLRCLVGDRAGALAAYNTFCRRIRSELDVEPMPETVRFKERLSGNPVIVDERFADSRLAFA